MASGDIIFRDLAQAELGTSLGEIVTITSSPAQHTIALKIVVCNFTATDRGYDLKVRPVLIATANKHFWRAGNTAGVAAARLKAGATEIWDVNFILESDVRIEGACEALNSISVSVMRGELED